MITQIFKFILLGIGAGIGYAMTQAVLAYLNAIFMERAFLRMTFTPVGAIPTTVEGETTDKRWQPTRADNFRSDVVGRD